MAMPTATDIVLSKIHPLTEREIRPIRNWTEWLERWARAASVEEMLGLLHVGFSVPPDQKSTSEKDAINSIEFYFQIADGWEDINLLRSQKDLAEPNDVKGRKYEVVDKSGGFLQIIEIELRQQVAKKAFDILCSHFFKRHTQEGFGRNRFDRRWEEVLKSNKRNIFPVIRDFFSVYQPYGEVRIRNLSSIKQGIERSYNEKLVMNFLLKLIEFVWTWKEENERNDEDKKKNQLVRRTIEDSRPWTIEVLICLDELDLLRGWTQIWNLDEKSLEKLEEIAFRNKFYPHRNPVIGDRNVVTIDEACYLGSPAAWLLKEHELVVREHERLTNIVKAHRTKQEAEEQIKTLSSK